MAAASLLAVARTGAQSVVAALQDAGVELAFGLPGVHNLGLWRALDGSDVRLVGVRHEQAAAYAADGYARASGRLGVAVVTTGPGAANTLAAVGEAWASRSPVVVIGTDVPTALRRPGVHRGALHEATDQRAMFAPVTKATFRAQEAAQLRAVTAEALETALAPPSRPVFLEVPTDLLAAEVGEESAPASLAASWAEVVDDLQLDAAVALLETAERPLIWAGGGVVAAQAGGVLATLAERLAAPVLTTYSGRGVLAPSHPCAVGLPPHLPEAGALWDEADVVLAVGSDLDGMMTQNWSQPPPPHLVVVNADAHDATKNYDADVVLAADARAVLEALVARLPERDGLMALSERLRRLREGARARMGEEFAAELAFLDAFAAAVPDEATVVCDMCIPGYWLGGFHPVPAPRRLAYPMGWGTLGWAFPAAIGAALAGPGPALAVCGDGGFLFACGELATVAQERPPVTALVVDDGGYGMLRYDFERSGHEPTGVDLHTPDFVALAQSFGVAAEAVDGLGEPFSATLAAHLANPEPTVLVARAALQPPPTTSPRWYRRQGV
jgi:thiamine pyrophosphate-dependent acetolactate synthase large subunit-like protein